MLKKICIGLLALAAVTANAATTTSTAASASTGASSQTTQASVSSQPTAGVPGAPPVKVWRPVFILSGGYAFTYPNIQTDTFTAFDAAQFTLRTDNIPAYSKLIFGGFAGMQWQWKPLWAIQMGLGFYVPACLTVRGDESQGVIGSPETTDYYQYSYVVTIKQLLAEAKLLYTWRDVFHPFLDAGLGASFNKARSYIINNPIFLTFSPEFPNGTRTSFSYRVGFGLDYDIAGDLRVGLAYHFTDFGQAELATGRVDNYVATNTNLTQDDLYANEVTAQFSFLF